MRKRANLTFITQDVVGVCYAFVEFEDISSVQIAIQVCSSYYEISFLYAGNVSISCYLCAC